MSSHEATAFNREQQRRQRAGPAPTGPPMSSSAFDKISKTQGVQAAVKAALAGGSHTSSKGTRIHFAGGGSRLARRKSMIKK